MGRPSVYTPDIADEICRRLAEGEGLKAICRDEHMPAASTVLDWVQRDYMGFSEPYARARETQIELMAEDLIALADDEAKDPQRSRLQVDARKWVMSKVLPKKYGDKIQQEVSGKVSLEGMILESYGNSA